MKVSSDPRPRSLPGGFLHYESGTYSPGHFRAASFTMSLEPIPLREAPTPCTFSFARRCLTERSRDCSHLVYEYEAADSIAKRVDVPVVTTAETPTASAGTGLLVCASPLQRGEDAIRDSRLHLHPK